MVWHRGRSFYSCQHCSAQEERGRDDRNHPKALDCWNCGAAAAMVQWVPPAVARARAKC